MEELLDYLLTISMELIQDLEVRQQLLQLILGLLRDVPSPDVFSIAKCIVYLDGHSEASKLLIDLVETGGPQRLAEAYQIAFDIYDNSSQDFLKKVREGLPEQRDKKLAEADRMEEDNSEDAKETDRMLKETNEDHEAPRRSGSNTQQEKPLSPESQKAFGSIAEILQGVKSIALNLEFLHRNNHANMAILKKLKDSLEVRPPSCLRSWLACFRIVSLSYGVNIHHTVLQSALAKCVHGCSASKASSMPKRNQNYLLTRDIG